MQQDSTHNPSKNLCCGDLNGLAPHRNHCCEIFLERQNFLHHSFHLSAVRLKIGQNEHCLFRIPNHLMADFEKNLTLL